MAINLSVVSQTSLLPSIDSLLSTGRYQLALTTLQSQPDSFFTNLKQGRIYESIDNYRKAAECYAKAIQFNDDYNTKLKLATTYVVLRKYHEAINIYAELVDHDHENLLWLTI